MYKKIAIKAGQRVRGMTISENLVVNAYSSKNGVTITRGMIDFVANDHEMAMIMGHEIAHYMLNHFYPHGISSPDMEAHSDKMGAYLAMAAGYDVCVGRKIWKRLTDTQGDYANAGSHPSMMYRYYQLKMPWCSE